MENKAHVVCPQCTGEAIGKRIVWHCPIAEQEEQGSPTQYYCGTCGWQDLAAPCVHHLGAPVPLSAVSSQ